MDAREKPRKQQISEVTQAMHDFHKEAWDRLDGLEANARRLKTPDRAERAAAIVEVRAAVEFIESDLWTHFRQEEKQVYSVLKRVLPPNQRRSVLVMEKDHQRIVKLVSEVKRLLPQEPSPETGRQLADTCLAFVELMREHINKENLIYQELRETD